IFHYLGDHVSILMIRETESRDLGFFFQAEDGIRDRNVTGVQTCALPIYWISEQQMMALKRVPIKIASLVVMTVFAVAIYYLPDRSEERRVGKECRYWWWWGQ